VASKHATNSASMVDAAMTDYFALFHEIAPKKLQPHLLPPNRWSSQEKDKHYKIET